MAWAYDWVSWGVSFGHWRKWQRSALPHLKATRGALILELAYGTGDLLLDILQAGLRPIGYDLSPYMGRIASTKLRRAGHLPSLVRGMAQQLPFPCDHFDGIVSTFPTEFIIHRKTVLEAYRVLKPGKRVVFVPEGRLNLTNRLARFPEWLYTVTGQRDPWLVNIEKGFSAVGFAVQTIEERLEGSTVTIVIAEKLPTW